MNRSTFPLPADDIRLRQISAFGERDGAIECDRAHHLRLDEVRRLRSYLPDPGVGLPPEVADEIGDLGDAMAMVTIELACEVGEQRHGREHLAVNVELQLSGGSVPDSNGSRTPVADERQLTLVGVGSTIQ